FRGGVRWGERCTPPRNLRRSARKLSTLPAPPKATPWQAILTWPAEAKSVGGPQGEGGRSIMSWVLLAFCGPVLWAISTHIEKYLVERFFKDSGVAALLIFPALIGIPAMPLIAAMTDVTSIGRVGMIVTSISGLLYLTAIYFYLRALQQEEASVIA